MRRLLGVLLVAGAGAAVWLLWPAEVRTPEDEVRALVADAVHAASHRDAAGVTASLAEDFHGGGLSRQELKQLVVGHLLRQGGGVAVLNPSLEVTLTGPDAARFVGSFLFAGDGASGYQISAELERRGGSWLVTSATWRPL